MGVAFPTAQPHPDHDPPPFQRWKERFGENLETALAGSLPEILEGEGPLEARHHAWSLAQAERLLVIPAKAGQDRRQVAEGQRLERLGAALQKDRLRHEAASQVKAQASRLSSELYRLKGQSGTVEFLEGDSLDLPQGQSAEEAAQRWFAVAKRGERGLARVAHLEADRLRQLRDLGVAMETGDAPLPPEPSKKRPMQPKPPATEKSAQKRADGKGLAFRSVTVGGFEVLIGKGDVDNDRLTFKVAAPLDWWLHVAGVPGSHVIIRNPDKLSDAPREVFEKAAELAAFHSKARDGGKVEVHLCRVADVSKQIGRAHV